MSYTFENHRAAFSARAKVNVLVGVIAKWVNDTLVAPSKKLESTERQGF